MGKRTVAVVTADGTVPADVADPLARGGFGVWPLRLSATAVPGDAAAVLVLVDSKPEIAAGFTRRCRAEATSPRPVVWLFTLEGVASAPTGFDSGADVCLVRPVDPDILLAQVNVLLRSYTEMSRVVAKKTDALDLNERLAKQFRQSDAESAFARRTLAAFTPKNGVKVGEIEAEWVHVPSTRGGVSTFGMLPTGAGLRFALATVGGLGVAAGAAVVEAVTRHLLTSTGAPAVALTDANRRLRDAGLPETAMLAATVGVIDATGRATVACGGHPPPVFVPAESPAQLWHGVGAFLGHSDGGYSELTGELGVGERLLLLAGGAAADKRPDVRTAVEDKRGGTLGEFVRTVADTVFTGADADDGYTLLAVQRGLVSRDPQGSET